MKHKRSMFHSVETVWALFIFIYLVKIFTYLKELQMERGMKRVNWRSVFPTWAQWLGLGKANILGKPSPELLSVWLGLKELGHIRMLS